MKSLRMSAVMDNNVSSKASEVKIQVQDQVGKMLCEHCRAPLIKMRSCEEMKQAQAIQGNVMQAPDPVPQKPEQDQETPPACSMKIHSSHSAGAQQRSGWRNGKMSKLGGTL